MTTQDRNRFSRGVSSGIVGALLFSALTFVPSFNAPAAVAAPKPEITWEKCPDTVTNPEAQCGRITVPTYYSNPRAGTISVGFVKVAAQDPNKRRGALFGNPGGPGGDAYNYVAGKIMEWPEAIKQEWDFIGVQPRGLEGSTPVKCDFGAVNLSDSLLQEGKSTRQMCEKGSPGYTRALTTENTARDWEMVRRALGYDSISIMGLSYGTLLGSTYATLYPQHTDKVVLDSAMDPSLSWNGILKSQKKGYNRALNDFFEYVARNNHRFHMGSTPLAAYQYWSNKVVRESGTNPTVVPPAARIGDLPKEVQFLGKPGADTMTQTGQARVTVENLFRSATKPGASQLKSKTLLLTRSLLPLPAQWEQLVKHINGTKQYPDEFPSASPTEQKKVGKKFLNAMIMQQLLMCNENAYPADPTRLPEYHWNNLITQDPFSAPLLRYESGAACNGTGAHTKAPRISGARLKHRPLQLSGTGDPQTPYAHRGTMARAMRAHLVTVHGPGHGHVGAGNDQVDNLVVDYLRTGTTTARHAKGLH